MEKDANYRSWMAEQIAKSYLYETNLIDIYQNDKDSFDFKCIMKNDIRHLFVVEVKASQYNKSEILRVYKKTREKYLKNNVPVLMLYINYIDKTGYFEFIKNQLYKELSDLNTSNLKLAIKNLSFD